MGKTRRNNLVVQSLVGLGLMAAVLTLYFFPPAEHSFYPRCIFHWITGWNCPGCGSLRAMHQLLHGDLTGAFALNPFFVILLPLLGILAWRHWVRPNEK